jgi:Cu+-exporting ATPase
LIRDFKSFFPIAVQVKHEDQFDQVPIENLKVNDVIQIHHGELVPVDALLSKGDAHIDYSFVTGESIPVPVEKGSIVYAGGKQTEGRIELVVVKEASQSYLTQLWNRNNDDQQKPGTHPFIDGLSRYFTYIVFAIALSAAAYWFSYGRTDLMWNAITTILIVACPCALLLSANFTTGNILRILSLNKFYLKNARVLEMLSNITSILFDKTGTLTFKSKMKITYEGLPLDNELKNDLAELLIHSNHPLSRAIYHHLDTRPVYVAEHFKMTTGLGIEGWIDERHIKIGSPAFNGITALKNKSTLVCVSIDQKHIGTFTINRSIELGCPGCLSNSGNVIHWHYYPGIRMRIMKHFPSKWDRIVISVSTSVQKIKWNTSGNCNKNQVLAILMLGDGLNDVPALRQSHVGIAVSDGDNAFAPAADGIIEASHISILDRILDYIKAGKKIILLSFCISILYNVVGLYYAVQGILSPLIAAILMPMSSITIILITYGLSNFMARRYHLNLNHTES